MASDSSVSLGSGGRTSSSLDDYINQVQNLTSQAGTNTGASGIVGGAQPTYSGGAQPYQYSNSAFGTKVAPTPMPDPYGDLSKIYPNLSGTNAQMSGDIMSQLQGQLSPETLQNLQDSAATFGVNSGMPGSQLSGYGGLRNLGLATEDLQNKGIANYNATIPTISSTQTVNPALQSEINSQNAINAAAPDPGRAASYAQGMFDKYLKMMENEQTQPQGGTSNAPNNKYTMAYGAQGQVFDLTTPAGNKAYAMYNIQGT